MKRILLGILIRVNSKVFVIVLISNVNRVYTSLLFFMITYSPVKLITVNS